MFEFICGKLTYVKGHYLTLETHGVGYRVIIPMRTIRDLPQVGNELCLYTAFVIREFSQTLYGFFMREERDLFELLIDLSGIGPKTALSILSHMKPDEFHAAVSAQNQLILSKIPGIGKKTAERLLVDLKGKWSFTPHECISNTKHQDALSALVNLGYHQKKAELAIQKAVQQLPQNCDISELIRVALKIS